MKDENGTKLLPCPECGYDDELSITSCRELRLTQVSCRDCAVVFESGCVEENAGKYWNRFVSGYKEAKRVRSLEKDRERLDWLERQRTGPYLWTFSYGVKGRGSGLAFLICNSSSGHESARAAIDDAMSEASPLIF